MIIKGREGKKLIVDLITIDRVQNYSITDFLLCIDNSLVERSVDSEVKILPTFDIRDGEEITVRHVKSPSEFYVSVGELGPDEHAMRERMNNFYFNNHANFTLFVVGTICAMAQNNEWHRVEILTTPNHEKKCKVQFVDTGKEFWALYDELFELDKQFYEYERFAWRCCLADIEPIFKPWPVTTTNFFRDRLYNCEHPVEVKVMKGTKNKVKLFAYFEGLKININQALVFYKLAKLSPGAIVEPYFEEIYNYDLDEKVNKKLHLVELVDYKSPFDFQIKFPEFHQPIESMTMLLQKYVPQEQSEVAWQVGDKCLVKCKVKAEDKNALWHRGCIIGLNLKPQVELLDYGTQLTASFRKLHKCPPEFAMMNTTIEKARMACTKAKDWSEDDDKKANDVVKSYGKFFATFKDNNAIQLSKDDNDEPRPVVLWGKNDDLQNHNIVQELEDNGLVVSTYKEKSTVKVKSSDMSFLDFSFQAAKELKKQLEEQHEQAERSAFVEGSTIEVGNHRVMFKKCRINQWKEAEPKTDISFTAMPTFVDNDGNIILHDFACETDLDLMNKTINTFFQGLSKEHHSFKAGDPCTVLYASDARECKIFKFSSFNR
jgi:Tudor domain